MSSMKQDEIVYAKKLLKKMHPLYNLDIELCLPFLDPVIGVGKRCFGIKPNLQEVHHDEGVGLASSDQLKNRDDGLTAADLEMADNSGAMAVDEDGDPLFDFFLEEGEDPIGRLGYGVVSYFSLIHTMMIVFALITCFFVPVMYNNSQWFGYDGVIGVSWMTTTTLGNLGQSETRCSSFKLIADDISIGCMTGKIKEVTHYGVYAADSEADHKNLCSSDKSLGVSTGNECADLSSHTHSFYTEKLEKCKGLRSCLIHHVHEYMPIGNQPDAPQCELKKNSSIYVQYTCHVSDEHISEKREQALFAACVSCFSCLVLLAVIKFRKGSIGIEKREWDLQTVTASDYTIEIKIYEEQYKKMMQEINRSGFLTGESSGLRLKLYLKKLIEERTHEIGGEGGSVGDINFAYNNMYLLDGLVKRGDFIKYKQWDKLNALNCEMTRMLHENIDEYVRPVCAFISMESETAYNHIVQSEKFDILGKASTVKEAVEPTNIIWENRNMNKLERAFHLFAVFLAIGLVLLVTFAMTTYAKNLTNETIGKYDDSIKCSELNKIYDSATLAKLSADDWLDYYQNGGDDMDMLIPPTMSCFCDKEYSKFGNDVATKFYLSSSGKKVQTCSEIFDDRALVGLIAMMTSTMIVAVNFILKVILVEMI